jgi:NAD(P)-dependent dehydrogenase (short-subunit alcohol dehydrogenase family)
MTHPSSVDDSISSRWGKGLAGKTAIITGAGRMSGIGRTIALEFARQGVNIVITGTGRSPTTFSPEEQAAKWRDIDSVAEEARALGAKALPLVSNIADPAAVESMVRSTVEEFGRIDILVNNASAAVGPDRVPLIDLPVQEWQRVLNVNLTGVLVATQAVVRQMKKQGSGGSIINISSASSRLTPPNAAAYAASKAGLNALSRCMAKEFASDAIRVNAVLPGFIETARTAKAGFVGEKRAQYLKNIPLGRGSDGSDIASMCSFLASDFGAWITGQDIAVDGGASWH